MLDLPLVIEPVVVLGLGLVAIWPGKQALRSQAGWRRVAWFIGALTCFAVSFTFMNEGLQDTEFASYVALLVSIAICLIGVSYGRHQVPIQSQAE